MTFPCKCQGWAWRLHNNLCVCPWRSYCVVGDLTARLWGPYGDPFGSFRAALPQHLFWAYTPSVRVLCDPTASTADATSLLLVIILCSPRRSPFFLDALGSPWDHCENTALVWQGFKQWNALLFYLLTKSEGILWSYCFGIGIFSIYLESFCPSIQSKHYMCLYPFKARIFLLVDLREFFFQI